MPLTWGGKSTFQYLGSVEAGTEIQYGNGSTVTVSAQDYVALRQQLLGLVVAAGTSRTNPPPKSLGSWLQNNVTHTAIASYVAAILVLEGYAERIGKSSLRITR